METAGFREPAKESASQRPGEMTVLACFSSCVLLFVQGIPENAPERISNDGVVVQSLSQPLNHAPTDATRNSSCVSTEWVLRNEYHRLLLVAH